MSRYSGRQTDSHGHRTPTLTLNGRKNKGVARQTRLTRRQEAEYRAVTHALEVGTLMHRATCGCRPQRSRLSA